jgi:hypothetical protein
LIAVAEMPRPLPPVAVPGPQIFFSVPKSPGPGALELALADAEAVADDEVPPAGGFDELDPERPHAARAVNVVAATATAITRVLCFAKPRLTAPLRFR